MVRILSARWARWLLAVVVLLVPVYGALEYVSSARSAPLATPVDGLALRTVPVRGRLELDRLIRLFEARIADRSDPLDYRRLGLLYTSRARLDGDANDYLRAEAAMQKALDLDPDNVTTQTWLAQAVLALHDFKRALKLSNGVLELFPTHRAALAIQTDALMALGRYQSAASRLSVLERLAGDHPAVKVRRSQLAWVYGDVPGSLESARQAAELAAQLDFPPLDRAWYQTHLANRLFSVGELAQAESQFVAALVLDPVSVQARAGLGRVRAAQGRIGDAIDLYTEATTRMPLPGLVAELGDLHAAAGRTELAEQQYQTVEVVVQLSNATGVYVRSLALFFADHRRSIPEAVSLTTADLELRQDVGALDAHGWSLYQAGEYRQARSYSDQAIGLGSKDAEMFYHAALISLALGENERAREELTIALTVNPYFDVLQAPHAQTLLSALEA